MSLYAEPESAVEQDSVVITEDASPAEPFAESAPAKVPPEVNSSRLNSSPVTVRRLYNPIPNLCRCGKNRLQLWPKGIRCRLNATGWKVRPLGCGSSVNG